MAVGENRSRSSVSEILRSAALVPMSTLRSYQVPFLPCSNAQYEFQQAPSLCISKGNELLACDWLICSFNK